MDKQITKLDSDELLEISGGRETYVKRSWADKFDTVGLGTDKNDSERDDESTKDVSEVSIDLKRSYDEEDE